MGKSGNKIMTSLFSYSGNLQKNTETIKSGYLWEMEIRQERKGLF